MLEVVLPEMVEVVALEAAVVAWATVEEVTTVDSVNSVVEEAAAAAAVAVVWAMD